MKGKDELSQSASVWAPASLSNLGPGFDSLGVAITGLGDRVVARRTRRESSVVIRSGDTRLPTDVRRNTASVAALKVMELAGVDAGVSLELEKGIPFGSGLGGSAACAAAGAVAANAVLGNPLSEAELVEATLDGESIASGSRHGDNAIPALLGGIVLVDASDPQSYRAVHAGRALNFAIVVPEIQVETSLARRMLPAEVPFSDAVRNASSLAWLLEAVREGDIEAIGRMIMRDNIVEPVRAGLIPCYGMIKSAAMETGAAGCALSGSGPAIFAVCEDTDRARTVLAAMVEACRAAQFSCLSLIAGIDPEGARIESPVVADQHD